jgi:hypothetical protein
MLNRPAWPRICMERPERPDPAIFLRLLSSLPSQLIVPNTRSSANRALEAIDARAVLQTIPTDLPDQTAQ